jgi:hypothetical protein
MVKESEFSKIKVINLFTQFHIKEIVLPFRTKIKLNTYH